MNLDEFEKTYRTEEKLTELEPKLELSSEEVVEIADEPSLDNKSEEVTVVEDATNPEKTADKLDIKKLSNQEVKELALKKMLDEIEKEKNITLDPIHNWICEQEEDYELFRGILTEGKSLLMAINYCGQEAQKQVAKSASFGMVDAATVYGWVRHYFVKEKVVKQKSVAKMKTTAKMQTTSLDPAVLEREKAEMKEREAEYKKEQERQNREKQFFGVSPDNVTLVKTAVTNKKEKLVDGQTDLFADLF